MSREGTVIRSFTVGAAALADPYLLVKTPAAVVISAAASDAVLGVAQDSAGNGDQVPVALAGVTKAVAGAAINKGAVIQPAAAGKVITQTSTNPKIGIALEAASGDGHIIDVLLQPVHG
jgi:hypothetical protein